MFACWRGRGTIRRGAGAAAEIDPAGEEPRATGAIVAATAELGA